MGGMSAKWEGWGQSGGGGRKVRGVGENGGDGSKMGGVSANGRGDCWMECAWAASRYLASAPSPWQTL